LIGLNLGDATQELAMRGQGTLVLTTHLDREASRLTGAVTLRPHEGIIVSATS